MLHVLKDLWYIFENEVFPIPSTDVLYNQYKDNDPRFDLPRGNEIRKENL